MYSFKTYLKKAKYSINNLLGPHPEIPSNFRLLSRRDSDYQRFIISYCSPSDKQLVNLNEKLKIFGNILKITSYQKIYF